jgi:hypothetical protein
VYHYAVYTREILEPRHSPIENGELIQGTWTSAFRNVDLLDVKRPYRCPLPRWIRDCRIKEWEYFIVEDDRFFLAAILGNVKLYRMARVFLHDRQNGEKLSFWKIEPFRGLASSHGLANVSLDSRSMGFFFRIHNWLDAGMIKLDINIEAKRRRPSFTAHVEFDMRPRLGTPMAVSLSFFGRQGMYAFKGLAPVRGDMVFRGSHVSFEPAKTSGLFTDSKGFFPYRMQTIWCSAMGFDSENRRFGFSIAENQTRETFNNNENALWLEGALTPLPPVKITMPGGINSDWIIQDVEGMVDLVFTPKEQNRSRMNLMFSNLDYETPLGIYNGMLLTAGGEQIQVRGLWGTGERLYLRV